MITIFKRLASYARPGCVSQKATEIAGHMHATRIECSGCGDMPGFEGNFFVYVFELPEGDRVVSIREDGKQFIECQLLPTFFDNQKEGANGFVDFEYTSMFSHNIKDNGSSCMEVFLSTSSGGYLKVHTSSLSSPSFVSFDKEVSKPWYVIQTLTLSGKTQICLGVVECPAAVEDDLEESEEPSKLMLLAKQLGAVTLSQKKPQELFKAMVTFQGTEFGEKSIEVSDGKTCIEGVAYSPEKGPIALEFTLIYRGYSITINKDPILGLNCQRYEGGLEVGRFHGQGTLTLKTGKQFSGVWNKGVLSTNQQEAGCIHKKNRKGGRR